MKELKTSINYIFHNTLGTKYMHLLVLLLGNIALFIAVNLFLEESAEYIVIGDGEIIDILPDFVKYFFLFLAAFLIYFKLLMLNTYKVGYEAIFGKRVEQHATEKFYVPIALIAIWILLQGLMFSVLAAFVTLFSFSSSGSGFDIFMFFATLAILFYQYLVVTPCLFRYIYERSFKKALELKKNYLFARVNLRKFMSVGVMDIVIVYTFAILVNVTFLLFGDENALLVLVIDTLFALVLSLYNFIVRPYFIGTIYKQSLNNLGIEV